MKFYDDEVCECWLCGKNGCGDTLDKHHIFGRAYRKKSEQYGLTVPLCHSECHIFGEHAVHNDPDTMQRLHEYGQRKAMTEQDWTVRQFVTEFGRNYLDIGPEDWDMTIEEIDGKHRSGRSASSAEDDTSSVTAGDTFPSRGRQDGGAPGSSRPTEAAEDNTSSIGENTSSVGKADSFPSSGSREAEGERVHANGWTFFITANAPVMPF